jgi:hypothetical protein
MKIHVCIILVLLACLFIPYAAPVNHENLINFTPPLNSTERDKETMAELMRMGSQGLENAQFDVVDTNYLR